MVAKKRNLFKLWTDSTKAARKKMEKKYPKEFKGKFIAIRKSTWSRKKVPKKDMRAYELGKLWYLEANKLYLEKLCKLK